MLTANGLRLTGQTPDGMYVEICEIADHPWYLGCQFHPEFKSKPLEPHPLFTAFIGAAIRKHRGHVAHERRTAREYIACRLSSAGKPLGLIAGPCVIESEEHVHFLAREIRRIAGDFIFKASFDKANRSSVSRYRGPGLAVRDSGSSPVYGARASKC